VEGVGAIGGDLSCSCHGFSLREWI
jgi:hypothetical protein